MPSDRDSDVVQPVPRTVEVGLDAGEILAATAAAVLAAVNMVTTAWWLLGA